MATNKKAQRSRERRDPGNDEYLELEKRLGRVEYELAADIAADSKAMGDTGQAAREHTRSRIGDIRRSRGDARG